MTMTTERTECGHLIGDDIMRPCALIKGHKFGHKDRRTLDKNKAHEQDRYETDPDYREYKIEDRRERYADNRNGYRDSEREAGKARAKASRNRPA